MKITVLLAPRVCHTVRVTPGSEVKRPQYTGCVLEGNLIVLSSLLLHRLLPLDLDELVISARSANLDGVVELDDHDGICHQKVVMSDKYW
jgi:hypothetical protein